jgi:hypothetical protein
LLIPHKDGAALIAKINVQSLSTLLKNRTTVEVRKHPPVPSHRGSLPGSAPNPSFRAAENQLKAVSFFGRRTLLIVTQN